MPLVSARQWVEAAAAAGRAVLGFNVSSLEMARGVIAAADEARRPALVQFNRAGLVQIGGPEIASQITRALAALCDAPVGLHLDHADSLEEVRRGLDAGFTSVMIDGSTLPFDAHVGLVQEARGLMVWGDLPLEAELGHVAGTEEGVTIGEAQWTDPEQAERFVRRTGVQWLAVAAGNVHGGAPAGGGLQIDRIRAIRERTGIPLVLHGASGLPQAQIAAAAVAGVAKINVGTGVHTAFAEGLAAGLAERRDARHALRAGEEAVRSFALTLLRAPYAADDPGSSPTFAQHP